MPLFETFGGLSPAVRELLQAIVDERQNRLTGNEYDQTTWAARTWYAFSSQKISVSVHYAAAQEIAHAMQLSTGSDPRGPAASSGLM